MTEHRYDFSDEYVLKPGEPPRPICCEPGCKNPCKMSKTKKNGFRSWKRRCASHCDMLYKQSKKYKASKLDHCENYDASIVGMMCPTNNMVLPKEALDVDHKDGDKRNDHVSNFWTLCKCCHAVKTINCGENKPRHKRNKHLPNIETQTTLDLLW